jgi:proline dehydrogenase
MNLPMVSGGESAELIALLLKLLPKLSQNTCDALTAHFVNGYDAKWVNELYGINEPNLNRAIKKLNAVNDINEQLIELKLSHLSDKNLTVNKGVVTQ